MSSTGGGIIAHNSSQSFVRNGKTLTVVNATAADLDLAEETIVAMVDTFCASGVGTVVYLG